MTRGMGYSGKTTYTSQHRTSHHRKSHPFIMFLVLLCEMKQQHTA